MNSSHPPSPSRNFGGTGLVLLLFAALPLGPLAVTWGRAELALWRAAGALRDFRAGKIEPAIAELRTVSEQLKGQAEVQAALADCLFESGDFAAAAAAAGSLDAVIPERGGQAAIDLPTFEAIVHLQARCLYAAGKKNAAMARFRRLATSLEAAGQPEDINLINGRAYYQALLGRQPGLDDGLHAMQLLLTGIQQAGTFGKLRFLSPQTRCRVASGLTAAWLGEGEFALPVLDRGIAGLEQALAKLGGDVSASYHEWLAGIGDAAFPSEPAELRDIRFRYGVTRLELATQLAVRAWVHESLGDPESLAASQSDRQAALELGHDPDAILADLPGIRELVTELEIDASQLDTFGYLVFRLGQTGDALDLVDMACRAQLLLSRAIEGRIGESPSDTREPEEIVGARRQTTAVLLLHRLECLSALGRREEAEIDRESIRRLGFDPDDPRLF